MENMHGTIKQKYMIFLLEIMKMVVLKESVILHQEN